MKKFTKTIAIFLMALFVSLFIGNGGMEAKAAGTITQTDAQKKSITVTWTEDSKAESYNVYLQEYGKSDIVLAGNTTELTYTLAGLNPATKYIVSVKGVKADNTESSMGFRYMVTLPDKMNGLKEQKWYYNIKQLNVEWDKQSAADGYEVKLYDNNNKLKKTVNITSCIARLSVKNNIVYKVKVRSRVIYNGKKYFSSWSTIYCLNQPMMKQLKLSGNKLQLKWDKVAGATQYKVYMSTKPNSGYKKVATVSKGKNSCTVKKLGKKKLSSKKKYYVYVEAVCNKSNTKNTSGFLYYWDTKQGVKKLYRN